MGKSFKEQCREVYDVARRYCNENGLSVDALDKQILSIGDGEGVFSQMKDVFANCLVDDMNTLPDVTLIVKKVNGNYVVKETEYTRRYLTKA